MQNNMTIKALVAAAALAVSGAALGGAHEGGGGHCNYVQENMFAGPFKVCMMPSDAAGCEVLGNTDDNSNAVHGDGDCAMDTAVGHCDMGDDGKLVYYEGDPGGLEIGCGFQGGEWVSK